VLRGSLPPAPSRHDAPLQPCAKRPDLVFSVRRRSPLDLPVTNSATALGLGPPPTPASERIARRLGLGVIGTLATILWMWTLAPPPL
jgi:hypothetical protein